MTRAGTVQSGYAFNLTVTGCCGTTRLMKFSLTSTSTSSDDMSTIVPMPVRVKPPPADIGETISPSCAALTVTIPANGARTTVSSRLRSARASRASATSTARAATVKPVRAAS